MCSYFTAVLLGALIIFPIRILFFLKQKLLLHNLIRYLRMTSLIEFIIHTDSTQESNLLHTITITIFLTRVVRF